jgi:undecaprenyl-phosphate 4-deoxy-4-formamido-L-arabinose transferase
VKPVLVSVIVPIYNEAQVLAQLFSRLYPAMDRLGVPYEVVLVDDGSRDRSPQLIRQQVLERPDRTRGVLLAANVGQHLAIFAGFEHARGDRLVTLDADLQNPPEEIGKVLDLLDKGHDYVGGVRLDRHDPWWRAGISRLINRVRESTTRIRMTDHGCMLRAYERRVVDAMLRSGEVHTFIPALAYTYSRNPTEVEVQHAPRAAGESKYSLFELMRLNFDLMTGFTVGPLRAFSVIGIALSMLAALFVVYLVLRRLWVGPEAEGVFTLFAINFFLIGIALFGIGMLGEYVGRIYEKVRDRPRYLVQEVLEPGGQPAKPARWREAG